jgi:hypothetical protein
MFLVLGAVAAENGFMYVATALAGLSVVFALLFLLAYLNGTE